jgi:ribonuclease D
MQEYLSLSDAKKAVFEKVLEIRENTARELDRPPNDILTKEQVFRLVKDPGSASSLSLNPRMPASARNSLIESLRGIDA